jgi:SAM-dependent methyltransferase
VERASAPVTAALVAALDPRADDVVLELAAGTGGLTAALAPLVRQVVSTDLSPQMVVAAARRALPGAEHRVMDMQSIELADASVDAVVSRFGLMLAPDPALALREARRVLRPGGRLAFATWAPAARNPWATAFGPVLVERGLVEPPQPGAPGQFALAEPERIEQLVRDAGFASVAVREVELEWRFPDWWEYRRVVGSLATSLRELLPTLDEATVADVDAAARARVEPYRRDDGYALPGLALVTSAR